jgi:hypothetical protein
MSPELAGFSSMSALWVAPRTDLVEKVSATAAQAGVDRIVVTSCPTAVLERRIHLMRKRTV